ncbi:phosphonate C-P lyase system protein PhnG, partial [Escherichia coli]|uniref:phosphonate C-P lyase system protein PhnG n=1 Tax=Escherichia coli TaxID=562 RepID=UPI00208DACC3
MTVLAHSDGQLIAECLRSIDVPAHEALREPENGLVMVRGRIGGDGAPFNLGEATVSRAAVRLATGEVGFGYTLGRDLAKARMIALCDA